LLLFVSSPSIIATCCTSFIFYYSPTHLLLPSFPTRRSSDLAGHLAQQRRADDLHSLAQFLRGGVPQDGDLPAVVWGKLLQARLMVNARRVERIVVARQQVDRNRGIA